MPNPDAYITSREVDELDSRNLPARAVSDNYDTGASGSTSAGWKIERDTGRVEFNDGVWRGEVDGAILTGGLIRTRAGGNRVTLGGDDPDRVQFYSGDSEERTTPAYIGLLTSLLDGTTDDRIQLNLIGPGFDSTGNNAGPQISLQSPSRSSTGLGLLLISNTDGVHDVVFKMSPFVDVQHTGGFSFPTGSTHPTGPGGVPRDGSAYVDTVANEFRVYEGGAWRTVGSW